MSILNNLLHPIKATQKWAITKLLEGIVNEIPEVKSRVAAIWELHKDEIFEKVKKAIHKAISDFIKKKIEEQRATNFVESDN